MAMTLRITEGRTMMLDGSHLFPMEQPQATAAAIEASLLNLASRRGAAADPLSRTAAHDIGRKTRAALVHGAPL